MANSNSARNRSSDSFNSGPAPGEAVNDPLAELARLIGRTDPFTDLRKDARAARRPDPGYDDGHEAAPQQDHDPGYAGGAEDAEPAPSYQQPYRQFYAQEVPPQPDPAHEAHEGYPADGYAQQGYGEPHEHGYEQHGYEQGYPEPHAGYPRDLPGFERPDAEAANEYAYSPPLYPQEQDLAAMPDEDGFDEQRSEQGRRRGLMTVAAVLCLAVVGTAAAFGYRTLFGGAGPSSPPPVIHASDEPNKVAPPPGTADPSAGKISYDRFADAGKDEKVVRREEKPVDLSQIAPAPRSVFPPVSGQPAATAPNAIGEPKRVRTVPIRPDQPDIAAAIPSNPADPTSTVPARNDAVASADATSPPVGQRAAARATARSNPAPVINAPLSLSPDSNTSAPPTAEPRPAASARVASAPAAGGGSFLVQVTSQRSEADAQSAFRSLQTKYASVLGSHPHTIRRADLGAKGVYYRAMVGPFASREQAIRLCSSLKQAGGDCVVQH